MYFVKYMTKFHILTTKQRDKAEKKIQSSWLKNLKATMFHVGLTSLSMQVKVNNLGYKYKSKKNSSVVNNTVSKKSFILSVFGGSTTFFRKRANQQ